MSSLVSSSSYMEPVEARESPHRSAPLSRQFRRDLCPQDRFDSERGGSRAHVRRARRAHVISGIGFGGPGARVVIGGVEAKIVDRSQGWLTAVVPASLEPGTEADLLIEDDGGASLPVALRIVAAAPGSTARTLARHPGPRHQSGWDAELRGQSRPTRLRPQHRDQRYRPGRDRRQLHHPGDAHRSLHRSALRQWCRREPAARAWLRRPVPFVKVYVPAIDAAQGLPAKVPLFVRTLQSSMEMTISVKSCSRRPRNILLPDAAQPECEDD